MNTEITTLPPAQRAVVALNSDAVSKNLSELVASSQSITAITNAAGREECHAAAMRAKGARVGIEKAGKAARDDATAFSKAVIAEEKRLIAIIEPEEDRLLGIRDNWDAEREADRHAKIPAERVRVDAIRSRIDAIRNAPLEAVGKSSADILQIQMRIGSIYIDGSFAEFAAEAKEVNDYALEKLDSLLEQADENARIAAENRAEQERIDRLAKDQAAAAEKLAADIAAFEKMKAGAVEQEVVHPVVVEVDHTELLYTPETLRSLATHVTNAVISGEIIECANAWESTCKLTFEQGRIAEREACAVAVEAEHLECPSDSDGDQAYDTAIDHAAAAIRMR